MFRVERKPIVWALIAALLLGMLMYGVYQRQTQQRLAISQAQTQAAYGTIITGYADFADAARAWMLGDPRSAAAIRQLLAAPPETPEARGLVYRQLYPFFETLRAKQVRQLQFIGRDGRSRLRLHAPDRFGDPLFDIRPLVKDAIELGKPMAGFENGRVFHGFRYVYPVFAEADPAVTELPSQTVLGALEVSLSFTAIRRLLGTGMPEGTAVRFYLRRDDLLRAVQTGTDQTGELALFDSMYQPSSVHPGFVTEDLDHPLYGEPTESVAETTRQLELKLGSETATAAAMDRGEAFARPACLDWRNCYLVNFLPVRDRSGKAVAYVVTQAQDVSHAGRAILLGAVFLVGVLLLLALSVLGHHWLRSREQMRVINQHVGKGIYVVDARGIISYANPAAAALLGFSVDELLGQQAHDLLHAESNGQHVAAADCPILKVALHGETYQSTSELFRCKDGSSLPVEVTASPIRELGAITGVVTLFSDIRERLAVEARLRQSDAAFNQAAEGVLITDASNRIVAINHAFTTLTGYTEADVLGNTPRVLSSGQHPKEFYDRMWVEIRRFGHWQGEVFNRRKNGSVYPEWLSIAAIKDAQGKVTNYVAVFNDISDLKDKEARLDFMAHHDTLTGLPNRSLFADRLGHALAASARNNHRVAVLFMDLDRFKQVNDSLGHDAGDQLLIDTGERIAACLRQEDTLGRQGGDEFVILLERLSDGRDAAQVAEKVINALKPVFRVHDHEVYIGGSIGISLYPDDGQDVFSLLKHADNAMYLAKAAGGNTWRFFNPALAEDAVERLTLEVELRRAMEREELRLHYQPKIDLADGRIQALEVLLRWQHPQRGLLAPGAFLKVAKEAGMMVEIGAWVMHRAARQAVAWRAMGLDVAVSVNVDGSQLSRDLLVHLVTEVIEQTGLSASRLGLEITETAIMEQPGGVVDKLATLRALGVHLYIDDFGTGHSSLARLKQLPISVLKVDAAFVRDMVDDASDRAIVRATVALAHELDMKVVAEGVETVEQLRLLREIGCDGVQGYLLARPMPADQVEALLRQPPALPA
jgi:diguanylate cyclase (GGDEF)-like protein/PAS domain S-box-containing protein